VRSSKHGTTYSIVGLNEGIVDGNDLDIGVRNRVAEDDTADTAESVDANLDGHFVCIARW
jgi:hypothetical protein